jgi:hypothetical protein
MDIQQRTVEQLEELAAKGPKAIDAVIQESAELGYIVGVPPIEGRGIGASLRIGNYDRYSVMLRYLEVYDNSLTLDSQDIKTYLEQCAAEISQRVTFLEEPLTLVELEPTEAIAQLRSGPPLSEQNEDKAIYWELLVQATPHPRLKLARYQWQAGKRDRENILYPVTFVTIGRIAKNLAASLTEAAKQIK